MGKNPTEAKKKRETESTTKQKRVLFVTSYQKANGAWGLKKEFAMVDPGFLISK